ncbi:MAG: hypothetical protein COA43_00615 [Robiginitomaculum sp.]|nr:MAG: hypothetical protein COA43_00615 [Robiginitomaculum sp.]
MSEQYLKPNALQIWSFNQNTTENSHTIVSKTAKIRVPVYNSNSGAYTFIAQDNGRDYVIEVTQEALQAMADAKRADSNRGNGVVQ